MEFDIENVPCLKWKKGKIKTTEIIELTDRLKKNDNNFLVV